MTRALSIVTLLALPAWAQKPMLHVHIEPAKGILVGQPVHLIVTVLVPNYFTGSPAFPEFEIENAIVVLPQETPQNSSQRIGAATYAGITETYTLYPQQPGDFQVPSVQITVPYASAPPTTTLARLALPPLTFHAAVPAAANNLDYFLPTTRLTIHQKWSSPLKNLRAGDSIERIVTVTASKMQAMLIPPLPFAATDGIRIYPEQPVVQDQKTDRGDFLFGRRTESAKYFIQKAGNYTLPPIELKWWNLSTNGLATAALPSAHFTATVNPDYKAELLPETELTPTVKFKKTSVWNKYKVWIQIVTAVCIAVVLIFWIGRYFLPPLCRRIEIWRRKRKHSERAYFRNLQRECRRNHSMEAYRWLLRWLRLSYPSMTVHEFLSEAGDAVLSSEADCLGASLFANGNQSAQWKGRRLADLMKQHRKTKAALKTRHTSLPNLNP